jgi:hypothetical protein
MRPPSPLTLSFALAAFAGGVLASRFGLPDAHAQQSSLASTIYVPADGLAFRTFNGHVIAKLSSDSHGGVLELYDENEHPAVAVRSGGTASSLPGAPAAPTASFDVFQSRH